MRVRSCCSLAVALVAALPAWGQPKLIRLSVEAAAAPVPALRYQLLPELRDTQPGNAALLYQRAHAPEWFNSFRRAPEYDKVADWVDLPDYKIPWKRVQAILPWNALKEIDLAARREYCDWELTERARKEGFSLLLPDFQGFREYATLLALRARLDLHENRLDQAVYDLQTGFALSRHTAEAPTLINGLIGVSIANIMLAQTERLIEHRGAPNLYWALADLPRPFIDMRQCFQGERLLLDALGLSRIRDALRKPASPPLSTAELRDIMRRFNQTAGPDQKLLPPLLAALAAAKVYPKAKDFLLKHGFTTAQADALPVVQMALMYAVAEYDRYFDDMVKWVRLPYWQAQRGLRQVDDELRASRVGSFESGGIPLAHYLLPAMQKVVGARARLDRHIAALRCVEALRLYAAGHEGRLPVELADIKEVPVPTDPFTGKNFQYRLDGSTAVLSGPAPSGEKTSEQNSIRYEITLRQ